MKIIETTGLFQNITSFLEFKKENSFKIWGHRKVAQSIEHLQTAVGQLATESRLREVAGIREAITKLITTDKLEYYEKLKYELLRLNGNPPNTIIR